jgi:hypothetical protein
MILTVDVDSVPGFREILERQREGEVFDVNSRWGAEMDRAGDAAPLVILDFYLPEEDLGVEIIVDVDENPKAIAAGVQTGMIIVLDPDTNEHLQVAEEIAGVLAESRVFSVNPPDPWPAMAALQQRFDFPQEPAELYRLDVSGDSGAAALKQFFTDAHPVSSIGVSVSGRELPTIVLIDPDSQSIAASVPEDAKVEGAWGVLEGAENVGLTFVAHIDETPIGHWVLPEAPEQIVRAGSNGAHGVAIITEMVGDDPERSAELMGEAIKVFVPKAEALRSLRLKELIERRPSRDGGAGPAPTEE